MVLGRSRPASTLGPGSYGSTGPFTAVLVAIAVPVLALDVGAVLVGAADTRREAGTTINPGQTTTVTLDAGTYALTSSDGVVAKGPSHRS